MTRGTFDPSGNPERSGSTFTPPGADQISQLPEEFTNPPLSSSGGIVDFVPPPQKPAIDVSEEDDGKLLVIRMTGKLHKHDYLHFVPIVEKAVQKYGKVRMPVLMHNFHGRDASAWWEDVKFDVKHFNDIERLAIVGERTWEHWMAAFCKPSTTSTIRNFPCEHEAQAREWVRAAWERNAARLCVITPILENKRRSFADASLPDKALKRRSLGPGRLPSDFDALI